MKAPIYLALAFGVANGIGGGGGAGADERRPGVGGVGSGGKRDSIGAVGPGRVRDRGSIGGKFRPEQVGPRVPRECGRGAVERDDHTCRPSPEGRERRGESVP
jgi:hypothetical protein